MELEAYGRIASAVGKTRGNRASSSKKQQISAFQAQFHRLTRLKPDRLLGRMPEGSQEYFVQAVESLREAANLAPSDVDIHANLGGALRRLAMIQNTNTDREKYLREAAQQYLAARELNRHSTYPALNLVRIGYLLSSISPRALDWDNAALLEKTFHLCAFESVETPDDYWRALDLADTLLFMGEKQQCEERYRHAIQLIPIGKRKDVLRSSISTLQELIDNQAIPQQAHPVAEIVTALLRNEILTATDLLLENNHAIH